MSTNFIIYNSDIISKLDCSSLFQKSTKYAVTISAIVYASEPSFRLSVFLLCAAIFSLWNRFKTTFFNLIMTSSHQRFHDAVQQNSKQLVKHLLETGSDVNVPDDRGTTALQIAAKGGDLEMVELLLKYGADTSVEGKYGDTALNVSCTNGNVAITSTLLKHGSNINHRNRFGEAPLHVAAKFDQMPIVKLLLRHKTTKLDTRDCYGETALHSSLKETNNEIVKILLENNADITILNEEKFTVLDVAAQKNNEKQVHLLMPYFVLRANKGNCGGEFFNYVSRNETFETYKDECLKELRKIEKTTLSDSLVSFYDLLTKDSRKVVKYARNENLLRVLESNFCKDSFPIYYDIIRSKFRRGWKRKKLLEKCYSLFFESVRSDLPIICVEQIFDYFTDYELITMAAVEEWIY